MNLENIQDNIKRYVEGTLTSEERTDFEQLMATHADLQEEVRLYKALAFFKQNRELVTFSRTVGGVVAGTPIEPDFESFQDYLQTPKPSWWQRMRWWVLGMVAVLVVGWFGFYQTQKQAERIKIEQIVTENGILPDFLEVDSSTVLGRGIALYKLKNYAAAKIEMSRHLKSQRNDPMAQLYLGNAQLLDNDLVAAEATLAPLVLSNDSFVVMPARFSLAMVLLKKGEVEAAKKELILLKEAGVMNEQMEKVLREISEL